MVASYRCRQLDTSLCHLSRSSGTSCVAKSNTSDGSNSPPLCRDNELTFMMFRKTSHGSSPSHAPIIALTVGSVQEMIDYGSPQHDGRPQKLLLFFFLMPLPEVPNTVSQTWEIQTGRPGHCQTVHHISPPMRRRHWYRSSQFQGPGAGHPPFNSLVSTTTNKSKITYLILSVFQSAQSWTTLRVTKKGILFCSLAKWT
ncbi:hypothetical protein BJV74DRAFT_491021 [Russula compacta]|nr:hypothetical protein BJV74DRAFT_491021 [Russula compacta]